LLPSVEALAGSSVAIKEYLAWAFDFRSAGVNRSS